MTAPPEGGPLSAPEGEGADPEHVTADAPRILAGFVASYASELGNFWPIYQGQARVGRKDSGENLDIPVDDPTTSSNHAMLFVSARPARMKVEDLGSTNGTYLNEEKIEPGIKVEIADGDVLRFGAFAATIKLI